MTNNKILGTSFSILDGAGFVVYDIAMGSSYSDFYYVGSATNLADSTTTKTFTQR